MGNTKGRQVVITAGSVTPQSVSGETVSIPAGAAGTIKNFYLLKKPIGDSNGSFIGGFGDTSVVLTSTAFTTEVSAETDDADLTNGQYWIDYITGRGRGMKADTSTSMTVAYTIFTH